MVFQAQYYPKIKLELMRVKQQDAKDCGAACLSSIAKFYGVQLPIARIRAWAGTDQQGTNILGLIEAADQMGLRARGVRADHEALTQIPLPAIVHVVLKKSQRHHYMVLYKVRKEHVLLMDPAGGRTKKLAASEFAEIWSGVLVLFTKKEDFKPQNASRSVCQRFWNLVQPHWRVLLMALGAAVVYTASGLCFSIYIQKITDQVLVSGNLDLLNLMSMIMLVIILIRNLVGGIKSFLVLKTGKLIDAQLIMGYYEHLLYLPQRFFDTMKIGEIISRVNDAVKIRAFINNVAMELFINLLIVLFASGLMFIFYWKLALVVLLIIPLYTALYIIVNRHNKKVERRVMENAAGLESQLVESLSHIKTLKIFGCEQASIAGTDKRLDALLSSGFHSGMITILGRQSGQFLTSVFTIIVLWFGSGSVLEGEITAGELFSFYALLGYFTGPFISLIGMNNAVQNALIAADRLFEIMDLELDNPGGQMVFKEGQAGDIYFDKVDFQYGTRIEVFSNFSVRIKKNEITAIVGESGSGKTTLFSLLLRLYPLKRGMIRIGSCDLRDIEKESLEQLICMIPQEIQLFTGSIIDNIALGDPDPNHDLIRKLSDQLGISPFAKQLAAGIETGIGENGALLSGGQKQRIAIARALYKDPDILLMDEATSSLDSDSEILVSETIKSLKEKGTTVIIIAHQLNTIRIADRILVMNKGMIVEEGSHRELIFRQGHYAKLWRNQLNY